MEEFAVSSGDSFTWKQPKATKRYYELHRGEEAFGTLKFRSMWGTLAWARNSIQDWSFKRVGFLNPLITIRMPEAESDYALFHPRFLGGGTFLIPDGRAYNWEPINFWRTKWRFLDRSGSPVISFEQGSEEFKLTEIFKLQAITRLETSQLTNLDFSIFINLGFYLMVLHSADTAAASAAAAGGSS